MTVTVYTMQNCIQCRNTQIVLDKNGVEYSTIDIRKDPRALEVLDKYNFQSAPVVIVDENGETDAWCGFRTDKLNELAEKSSTVLA
ncbi:MAG: NrdH-redoxin [Candidatus Ancillula sp.]|jgi:glutaredoxin-like protein NrdH|nr:NrdH-redoxin [Candidatus Ancillula sp.]